MKIAPKSVIFLLAQAEEEIVGWKTFWFDGNQIHGIIDSEEKWDEIKRAYRDHGGVEMLRRTKEQSGGHGQGLGNMPSFGFRSEHSGEVTLEKWAEKEGMNLFN